MLFLSLPFFFNYPIFQHKPNNQQWLLGAAFDPGIDLLKGLNLHSNFSQYDGVSLTQGTQKKLAYKLQGVNRKLVLPYKTYQRAVELLKKNSEFTFAATLRQDERNPGTIISFSNGYNRYEINKTPTVLHAYKYNLLLYLQIFRITIKWEKK